MSLVLKKIIHCEKITLTKLMIWTESWGESKNDSKGEANGSLSFQVVFIMAAVIINVPLGHAFVNRLGKCNHFL